MDTTVVIHTAQISQVIHIALGRKLGVLSSLLQPVVAWWFGTAKVVASVPRHLSFFETHLAVRDTDYFVGVKPTYGAVSYAAHSPQHSAHTHTRSHTPPSTPASPSSRHRHFRLRPRDARATCSAERGHAGGVPEAQRLARADGGQREPQGVPRPARSRHQRDCGRVRVGPGYGH